MDPHPSAPSVPILLRAVPAVLLTLLCAAAVILSGPLAVGVHSGFYLGTGFFPTEPVDYAVQLIAQIVTMTLVAVVILFPIGRPRPAPRRRAGPSLRGSPRSPALRPVPGTVASPYAATPRRSHRRVSPETPIAVYGTHNYREHPKNTH